MIISFSTKKGAGIRVYGDWNDLGNIRQTVSNLAARSPMTGHLEEFVLELAYMLDKANEGNLERVRSVFLDETSPMYDGFTLLWPTYLTYLGILRWSAAFSPTSREEQSNLYRLEAAAEMTLSSYDAAIGRECMEWLETFDMFPIDFISAYVHEISYRFAVNEKPGKTRFRQLPNYLAKLSVFSTDYERFINEASFETVMRYDFDKIVW